VTLVSTVAAERGAARDALDRFDRAHARLEHPAIARAIGSYELEGRGFVELDFPAVGDCIELEMRFMETGVQVPYENGDGFIRSIRVALQAAHAIPNDDGLPHCLGRLSPANLLFDEKGRSCLVGFGHNVAVEAPDGRPLHDVPHVEAPELSIGGEASPGGDYAALLLFARMLTRHTDKRGAMGALLRAVTTNPKDAVVEILRHIETRFVGATPLERGSIDEGIEAADRLRAAFGIVPDLAGFERLAARAFEGAIARNAYVGEATLCADGRFFSVGDGSQIPLRGAMRRMVVALVEHHALGRVDPIRAVELAEVGWPGDRATYEAMMNRVYVTLTRLRARLPDGVLERFDDGYRLSPGLCIRLG
jgi:hypothetical protein